VTMVYLYLCANCLKEVAKLRMSPMTSLYSSSCCSDYLGEWKKPTWKYGR